MAVGIPGRQGRLKEVQEYLEEALGGMAREDGVKSVVKALADAAPWAGTIVEAAAESLPAVKFLLKLFEGVTKEEDPNALGLLACSMAYMRAVEQSVEAVMGLGKLSGRVTRAPNRLKHDGFHGPTPPA